MTQNLGLSVSDVVNVSVLLAPTPAQQRNFGSLLILGDSGVIDTTTRYRLYTSAAGVAADFGSTAPEYLAATLFFGQTPQPQLLYIGAWARTATAGRLVGGPLGTPQQALSLFTAISTGSFSVTVDGVPHPIAGVSFVGAANLNAVAALVTTALGGVATVTWDSVNSQFNVKSATTGTSSAVSAFTPTGSGVDISSLLGLTTALGAIVANGMAAETALAAATALANLSNAWYGLMFAASVMPADADYVALSAFIQASTTTHILGITTQEPTALVASSSADISSQISNSRTFVQYSSQSPYACAAAFGIAFTVNFLGAATTLTLKFKVEGNLLPEVLTESQSATLTTKNCNAFVTYNNQTSILQQGVMSNGYYFDVVHGTDWLQNYIQTAIYNLLLGALKIPQTDPGVTRIVATVASCCEQGVVNGLIAPGVWNGPAFGNIATGQTLANGYYVYAPPVATQSTADRAARKAPVLTAAIKLAGAIHSSSVILNVNQ